MSSNSTTSGASAADEASFYAGVNLQSVLYGIGLYFYLKTIHTFLARRRAPRKSDMLYAIFSSVALLFTTIWLVLDTAVSLKVILLNQSYPIGPVADQEPKVHASDVFIGLGAAAVVGLQQMAIGLLLYRCRVLWNSRRVIIIPSVLWLFTLALGILVIWVSSTLNYHSGLSAPIGIAYYSIVIFLNVTLTSMICYRVVRPAETMKATFGDRRLYLGTILLVESALLYTLASMAFLVAYGAGSAVRIAFSRMYILMMCVSPQMLILRLAKSKAQKKDQSGPPQPSVVRFVSASAVSGSEFREESGAEGIALETLPKLKSGEDGKAGV